MEKTTEKIINKKANKLEIFNYIFFGLVIFICIILTIVLKLSWLTLLSCVSGIMYMVFLSDKNILNFIVGFISSTTYIIVAFQAKLFGEVIFYLVVDLPMIIVSIFMWKKHLEAKLKVYSKKLSIHNHIIIIAISCVVVFLYAMLLKFIGGENVFVDAVSTVVSFVATLLMALRYREQWFMWIVVYLVSIIMWATTFDLLMLIMSISCFISCFIGFVEWSKKNETI